MFLRHSVVTLSVIRELTLMNDNSICVRLQQRNKMFTEALAEANRYKPKRPIFATARLEKRHHTRIDIYANWLISK